MIHFENTTVEIFHETRIKEGLVSKATRTSQGSVGCNAQPMSKAEALAVYGKSMHTDGLLLFTDVSTLWYDDGKPIIGYVVLVDGLYYRVAMVDTYPSHDEVLVEGTDMVG